MGDTAISWTHRPGTRGRTWNPTNGCQVVSPGCANCYAMRFAGRFSKRGERYHGLVRIAKNKRAVWTGESRLEQHMLGLPLRWRDPSTVFVNSMSDLFYEGFSNEQIAAVFGVMAACPQHTFQVLTKRADRMRAWFEWASALECDPWTECHAYALREEAAAGDAGPIHRLSRDGAGRTWPLPNVWLGVSVENQDAADERIPELLDTPAAVRFLSCEPLLGELWIPSYLRGTAQHTAIAALAGLTDEPGIDWVITGCESGPGARPCDVAWLRSLRDQCAAATVPFFLKQAAEDVERCNEGCGQRVRYVCTSPTDALASCGCTVEGPEMCSPHGIMFGDDSHRKAGGVIELPCLDGVQHAAFPEPTR